MNTKKTLVVIGNGMVGQHFLSSLAASPAKDDYEIVTFCEEPRAAYDRVHLSAFFSGKTAEDLSLVEPGFFDNRASLFISAIKPSKFTAIPKPSFLKKA